MKALLNFIFGPVFRAGFAGIEPMTVMLIGAGISAAAGAAGAIGTSNAQKSANKVASQQALSQNAQSWMNSLTQQGTNLQQLVQQFPDLEEEYERARRENGDKRNFNDWLFEALAAEPNHPIWDAIADPAAYGAAANTSHAAWARGPDGQPIEKSLFDEAMAIAGQNKTAQQAGIVQGWASGGGANLRNVWDAATPEDQAAYGSFENFVMADYEANATPEQKAEVTAAATVAAPGTAPGTAGVGSNTSIDPTIPPLIQGAITTASGIQDGTFLAQTLAGLKPVEDARAAQAAAAAARIEELRRLSGVQMDTELTGIEGVLGARTAGAGGIYDASTAAANQVYAANVDKLAALLGVRREAAQAIYDASTQSAGGVRDARTTGAKGIYSAESLQADTYAQAGEQALSRVLAQQGAERARRGFTGGSSGNDITRARLMSDAIQRGAGARAQAGVNLENRMSDTGVGYATDIGRAGVGRATTIGQSTEADAVAQLQASVQLAQQLGLAGTNKATTLAGAGEQNAIAELQARLADAQRRMGYLTSDADLAKAQADYDIALGQLNALTADQNRKIGAIGLPFQLASSDVALKGALTEQQYAGIDAMMKRAGIASTAPANGFNITTAPQGAVINPWQAVGAGLSAGAVGASDFITSKAGADWIASLTKGAGGTGQLATSPTGFYTPAGNAGVQTDWTSVFANPNTNPRG